MQLIIVRHGQCLGQCEAGSGDPDSELTPLGKLQAQKTADRLARMGITHVVSSPLVRALETASHIARAAGDLPIEVWPDLREGFSQTYQGFGRHELVDRYPLARLPSSITTSGWSHGGDTYSSFLERCGDVWKRLRETFGEHDGVVLVTHGGFANYLLHQILGLPVGAAHWFDLENGALAIIRVVPESERTPWPLYPPFAIEVLAFNDFLHLSDSPDLRTR